MLEIDPEKREALDLPDIFHHLLQKKMEIPDEIWIPEKL